MHYLQLSDKCNYIEPLSVQFRSIPSLMWLTEIQRREFYFSFNVDALSKALSTPAILAQKFAQFEDFPKIDSNKNDFKKLTKRRCFCS